jgi:hypothetical protein
LRFSVGTALSALADPDKREQFDWIDGQPTVTFCLSMLINSFDSLFFTNLGKRKSHEEIILEILFFHIQGLV